MESNKNDDGKLKEMLQELVNKNWVLYVNGKNDGSIGDFKDNGVLHYFKLNSSHVDIGTW